MDDPGPAAGDDNDPGNQRDDDLYRLIFRAALDGMALVDGRGIVIDVNPALGAIDGFPRAEVVGRYPPRFRETESREIFLDLVRRVLDGDTVEDQVFLQHRDGTHVPVETRSTRIMVAGEPHMLVVVRDLRERARHEGELRHSQDLYRALFEASLDGLVVLDAQGVVVDVNQELLDIDDFSREELIGQFPPAFRAPEMHRMHRRFIETVLERGSLDTEAELLRKDSSTYMAEMRSVRVDFRGEPRVLVVVRDISDRRERESDLERSEERYRTVFEGMIDGLALIRSDGIVVDVNQAMLDLDGFERHELIGKLPPTYIGHDDRIAAHREYVRRVLANEHVKREFRFQRKDGSHYDAEVRPICVDHDNERHVLLVIRDISEQKQAAAESERLQAQLRQAQKMEALGHLTGGIAHDFNNILTSALGYISMARDLPLTASDDRMQRYLARAERAGERARDLIAQMMTFSRGQQGERREVALAPLVVEALTLLESSLPASLETSSSLPDGLPMVRIDPVQFEQILVNLCINARDAVAGHGSLGVTLATHAVDGLACAGCRETFSGRYVEMAVSDNGPGIDAAMLDRIFEPFFTTKELGKGTGMGLSTVHGIVHDHGGHVLVDTAANAGTTMRVLLPMARDAAGEESGSRPVEPVAATPRLGGRVLVVDDNRDVAEYLSDLLASWGLEVDAETSPLAAEARVAAAATHYDLVITDQTMPRMSGLELARTIMRRSPDLPVFLYTGYSETVTEDMALAAGIRAFLGKPLDTARLRALVGEILG